MNNSEALLGELRQSVKAVFADYARGSDVSPARRYRTEGYARALIAAGVLAETEFAQLMDDAYRAEFGEPLPKHLLNGVSVPLIMRRAPVYPSS